MTQVLVRAWAQSLFGGLVEVDHVVLDIPDVAQDQYTGKPLDEVCCALGQPITKDFDLLTFDHLIHRTPDALLFEAGIYPSTGKRIS